MPSHAQQAAGESVSVLSRADMSTYEDSAVATRRRLLRSHGRQLQAPPQPPSLTVTTRVRRTRRGSGRVRASQMLMSSETRRSRGARKRALMPAYLAFVGAEVARGPCQRCAH